MSAGLLKLEKPYMVGSSGDIITLSDEEMENEEEAEETLDVIAAALNEETTEPGGGGALGAAEQGQIIDVLLPPFQWQDDGGNTWITRVSRGAPGRGSVITLWEQLDLKLVERQARPAGVCAVRSELFTECFDELIRQVTLDCAERGLMLARVRDEAQMTLTAFQALFESASEFGASKAIQAESGASDVEAEQRELEERVEQLEGEVRRLEAWKRQTVRRAGERKEVQAVLFTEELEALQRSEKQYQLLIETLLASKSSS